MKAYNRIDLEAVRGEGAYLFDSAGRRYLDFLSGVAVNALGHCHPVLVDALRRQAETLWHASNLVRIPDQERLADRLCHASFADAVFFTNSGGEAVDFSLKLIRRYFKGTNEPGRWRVITFDEGFHGRSMAAIAAGGQPKLTQGYEPVVDGFDRVPFADMDALRSAIRADTAAVFLEPIQGEGGVRPFPPVILREIRSICDEHGLLLVLDEVQTGFGRTGRLFAHENAGVKPDIVAAAKGIGAGFPLGAVLAVTKVADCVVPGSHGSTLGGSPLGAAVGNALLDVILADGFLDGPDGAPGHVSRMAEELRAGLQAIAGDHPDIVEEVRGTGLLIGLKCRVDNKSFMATLRDHGLLTAPAGHNVVRVLPPLNVEQRHIDEALQILHQACAGLRAAA
ncbi:MAG: aspartate aminotransferase family protein [Rhizobiaceae bacterium]|nr:aspartate aminotransferase family protein [Rhizobiaceae bacterium]